jgi:hypothetical protein
MMASALKDALGRSGGKLAGSEPETRADATPADPVTLPAPVRQPSRRDTAAITVHYPEPVRRQLKVLASEEGRHIDDMVAEALNLLFARYRKAEIAPRKASK